MGEFQVPRDPAIYNGHFMGLMDWAIQRYREGYDVYAYEEADGWNGSVLGPAYAEVKSAINDRKVSSIALIGYSHGGGTVWEMANNLTNNATDIYGSFEITFTGFIDAISQSGRWIGGLIGTIGPVSIWFICDGFANIVMETLGLYESTVSFLLGLPGLIIAIIVTGFAVSFRHRLTGIVIFLFWLGVALLQAWVTAAFLYG